MKVLLSKFYPKLLAYKIFYIFLSGDFISSTSVEVNLKELGKFGLFSLFY